MYFQAVQSNFVLHFFPCSEFTKAFQHAADRIQAHASFDYFDGSGKRDDDFYSEVIVEICSSLQ